MTDYRPPTEEMRFVLNEIAGLPEIAGYPGFEEATPDLVDAVLEEASKLATEVLAPLNHPGDRQGAAIENGVVRTPPGFKEAYGQFVEAGWPALSFDPAYGGQGLPSTLGFALLEMWNAANMSFALCPLLTQGAVDLLQHHGSEEQKALYLEKLIAGEWTGTMNLTEPQAGSDVGAVRTKAERDGAHYRIRGQKIYITYGEHDFADNIVHMVLARTPDAPAGTKGISLFIVPKFLLNPDGTPGPRNDLRCVSLERKLGIHASPTCVMAYGDNEGAVGYLIGEECQGMAQMFTMMNNARLSVGLQGVAIADRAYRQALAYARQRTQGRPYGSSVGEAGPIIRHPDVQRNLLTMKAYCEAGRALAYHTVAGIDIASRHPDAVEQERAQIYLVELLTPVVKAWCTDIGVEVASLGLQVHGGMGFIEETGAAQHYRDARINPIYEGTNGIQALDLVGRKIIRHDGATARALMARMEQYAQELNDQSATNGSCGAELAQQLSAGIADLRRATDWLMAQASRDRVAVAAAATPYLKLMGTVTAGWLMAKSAIAAEQRLAEDDGSRQFLESKRATARFYGANILPQSGGLAESIVAGARTLTEIEPELIH